MGAPNLACPVCDADLILAGDEKPGDLVHCTYCGAPFVLMRRVKDEEEEQARWEIEEDY
jgi:DNA-directed RNA polymerase subunit RPC12/RpoP